MLVGASVARDFSHFPELSTNPTGHLQTPLKQYEPPPHSFPRPQYSFGPTIIESFVVKVEGAVVSGIFCVGSLTHFPLMAM